MINSNGRTVPNQFIITDGNKKVFQSYDSKIAVSNGVELEIYPHWDYSKTTLRYLKQFINEETRYEYETKKQFEKMIDDCSSTAWKEY